MVAYFRSLEDQIKRSARREGENRQKEEKRQARREKRSPNQVEICCFISSLFSDFHPLIFNIIFSFNVQLNNFYRERIKEEIIIEKSLTALIMISCLVEME